MKEIAVRSRIITSLFFSVQDGKLYITFKNGEERLFVGVTEDVVFEMAASASPGQHYIDHIRTQFQRVA